MAGRDQHVPLKKPCLGAERKIDFPGAPLHTQPPAARAARTSLPPLALTLKRFLISGLSLSVVSLKRLQNWLEEAAVPSESKQDACLRCRQGWFEEKTRKVVYKSCSS